MTLIMVREFAITIYLLAFQIIFSICKLFPQKNKTVFVASFGDNALFVVNTLEKQTDEQIVILRTAQCKVPFDNRPNRTNLLFEPNHFFQWVCSIYHLATSSHVFVDNYFGFLAVTRFKANVVCIQLWHAAGAIKQFGLKDPSIQSRSPQAIERFKKVYNRFDHVVVGSEKMATIFQQSFGLEAERMLRTGIPRTDFFFDVEAMDASKNNLTKIFPRIKEKKVILYAPTYRDHELSVSHLALDIDLMYTQLKDDYILFLRLHPAVTFELPNEYPDFIYNVSHFNEINDLLIVTDILITDYSSIPFEFSLLRKPMIFFAYDLDEYFQSRGFWDSYENLAPGPVVNQTSDLIEVIKSGSYNMNQIHSYADEWNEYSTGHSSEMLVSFLYRKREQSH